MDSPTIGVLALQGDFAEHLAILRSLAVAAIEVRLPAQLLEIDALIIPGGESTTITRLLAVTSCQLPRSSGNCTARTASLFVRTESPRREETLGSEPRSLHSRRSFTVPSTPAERMTRLARTRRRSVANHAPLSSWVTS